MDFFSIFKKRKIKTFIDELYDELLSDDNIFYGWSHGYDVEDYPILGEVDKNAPLTLAFHHVRDSYQLKYISYLIPTVSLYCEEGICMNKHNLSRRDYRKLKLIGKKLVKRYNIMKQINIDSRLIGMSFDTNDGIAEVYKLVSKRKKRLVNLNEEDIVTLKLKYQ